MYICTVKIFPNCLVSSFLSFFLILYVVMWNNKKICRFTSAYEERQLCYLRWFQLLNLYNVVGIRMKYDRTGCGIIMTEFQNPQKKICFVAALSFINLTWTDLGSNTCFQSDRRRLIACATARPMRLSRYFYRSHVYITKKTSRHITTLFVVNMIRSKQTAIPLPFIRRCK